MTISLKIQLFTVFEPVMRFETLATSFNLLSNIIGSQYPDLDLISQLNNAFSFDHNIFLLHSSVELNRFVNSTNHFNYIPRCLFTFDDDIPAIETFQHRTGNQELLIVVPRRSNFESNLNLLSFVKEIQLFNINLKIGLFFPHIVPNDDLQKLSKWCWNHRIVNIFAAFGESFLHVFNFNPMEPFDVINVTGRELIRQIFRRNISNFQHHPFRLAVIDDKSIVQYSNVQFIDGPDEKLWKAVFSVLNATYSIFRVRGSLERIEDIDNGTVDILADLTDIKGQGHVTLYPIVMEILSIVVPKTKPLTAFEAFMKIATSNHFFGYFLVIVFVIFVLMGSRYINYKKCLILQCVADVVNLLLNENSAIKYRRLSFSEACLVVPMTFAGFVMANGFLSSLKSHLTRPVMQSPIETIEDFYRSPLPMTTPNEYWLVKDAEILNGLLKYGNFSSKIRVIEYSDFVQQILTEVPFSFTEYNSVAKFMCKHKDYRITPIQLQTMWYSPLVKYDFPFTDRVNEIIHRITTAGLYDKWWRDARIEDKLYRSVMAEAHTDRVSAPVFIIYGWIAGIIVLIIEINWKKIKSKMKDLWLVIFKHVLCRVNPLLSRNSI